VSSTVLRQRHGIVGDDHPVLSALHHVNLALACLIALLAALGCGSSMRLHRQLGCRR